MSRVKRRPVSLFYARVFIDMGEDHPLGEGERVLFALLCCLGGVSRSGACDAGP
jgi:hypothetical protein